MADVIKLINISAVSLFGRDFGVFQKTYSSHPDFTYFRIFQKRNAKTLTDIPSNIFEHFHTIGTFGDAVPCGSGHIHTTILLKTIEAGGPDYILQKINQHVFPDVELLMKNIGLVTEYLKRKQTGNDEFKVMELVPTKIGKFYHIDDGGNYWRMFVNIEGSHTYDVVREPKMAYEAGRAFGHFMFTLADFPVHKLRPVIPDFHSIAKRFHDFEKVLLNDPFKRMHTAQPEIGQVYANLDEMMIIPELEHQGKFPLRVTHNDTKINNVLFNPPGKAICVIDLDTVMPGLSLYDFGDAIRTAAATAAEDEPDLAKMRIDLKIFEAFAKGYLEKTRFILTKDEIDYLAFSCRYVTFLQAIRFLTDYLEGDKYYKTAYENHNLVRARAQFKLAMMIKNQLTNMKGIVQSLLKNPTSFKSG